MSELRGREAMKIQAVPGVKPYLNGKMAERKLSYRIFSSPQGAFIAEETHAFCAAFDADEIYSVDLKGDSDATQQLVGFTTKKGEIAMARTEVQLTAFTVENYVAGKLTKPEELLAL